MKNTFYSLVNLAVSSDSIELIRDLFTIQPYITESLGIKYSSSVELLELVIRTLVRFDLKYKLDLTFEVYDCPENEKEFADWFVKFFMILESLDDTGFELTEEHKAILYNEYSPYSGELELKPNYSELKVKFVN